MPYPSKKIEKILLKYNNNRFKYIFYYRMNCLRDTAFCSRFKSFHVDYLTLFYDIYIY